MQFKGPTPVLYVTDVENSIRFYSDLLGFACANRTAAWASLRRDHAEIMVSLPNEYLPFDKLVFTGSFYFQIQDVDALWRQLGEKVSVVYPLENFDYGMREFAIKDVNGYILQFGQEIAAPWALPALSPTGSRIFSSCVRPPSPPYSGTESHQFRHKKSWQRVKGQRRPRRTTTC